MRRCVGAGLHLTPHALSFHLTVLTLILLYFYFLSHFLRSSRSCVVSEGGTGAPPEGSRGGGKVSLYAYHPSVYLLFLLSELLSGVVNHAHPEVSRA